MLLRLTKLKIVLPIFYFSFTFKIWKIDRQLYYNKYVLKAIIIIYIGIYIYENSNEIRHKWNDININNN